MTLRLSTLLVLLAFGGWGCDSGSKNPPDGAIRVFHAAPGQGTLRFLRVERVEADLNYKEGSAVLRVDEDSYRFNVDVVTPSGPDRVQSFTRSLAAGTEYMFILYENGGTVDVLEYEKPSPEVAGSTDSEVQLFHLAPGVGSVDVYLEAPGTDPVSATAWGRIGFTGRIDPELRPGGEYQLTITAPGDPLSILFRTSAFTLPEGENVSFSAVEGAGAGTAALSVVVSTSTGVSGELFDEAQQPAMRVFHGARTAGPVDVVVNGDFGMPLVANVPFGQVSEYETTPATEFDLTVTPAGDPGVLEVETTLTIPAGNQATLSILGAPGALRTLGTVDDNRRLTNFARLRVLNQTDELGTVDVYVVAPGTDIGSISATLFGVQAGSSTGYRAFDAGDYELIIAGFGGDTPVAGPIPIQLATSGVYSAIVLDGIDTGTAEVFLFDDFSP
jgi:hypothetical protein